jgi:hypothetical protein
LCYGFLVDSSAFLCMYKWVSKYVSLFTSTTLHRWFMVGRIGVASKRGRETTLFLVQQYVSEQQHHNNTLYYEHSLKWESMKHEGAQHIIYNWEYAVYYSINDSCSFTRIQNLESVGLLNIIIAPLKLSTIFSRINIHAFNRSFELMFCVYN